MHNIFLLFVQDEEPNMQLVAAYLLQDPRARLADLKKTKTWRNGRGETKQWTDKSHQLAIPGLCGDMLGGPQYLVMPHNHTGPV